MRSMLKFVFRVLWWCWWVKDAGFIEDNLRPALDALCKRPADYEHFNKKLEEDLPQRATTAPK